MTTPLLSGSVLSPRRARLPYGRRQDIESRLGSTYMMPVTFSGINRRDALQWAKRLGCEVEPVRGTGEFRVFHPDLPRPIRINGRRKDAGRALSKALRHLVRQQ